MNVSIITAFPEMFDNFLHVSIPGRAVTGGLISADIINFRDFGKGNYKQLDDYAFGSGGMLFAAPQLKAALDYAVKNHESLKPFVIYPSPQGALITQEIIETLSHKEHVIIICGHYEGIDERFTERYVDLEVSVGDCVLTGGEIPAMMIIDSMSRLVPGVVGKSKAVIEDSFYRGMLDNPNYTRPAMWEGLEVPEVLLSGNAGEITHWRRRVASQRTLTRRPDLISRASIREYLSDSVNIAVMIESESENANLDGLYELSRAYDLGRPYIIAGNHELRTSMKAKYPEAKILGSIKRMCEEKENLLVIKVFAGARVNSNHSLEIKRMCLEHDGEILFLFAENEKKLEVLNGISGYIYGRDINIPLNIKIGIALDKFLGKR
ncbi:MAG: tRNA (guanosine(37)-N1)-methyltransferase TrmD [Synergistaceae bacterium]|nr:tRNA (guanosine(37)-N1)-methyltransferase TrmD [Synergistaceae bacterium]